MICPSTCWFENVTFAEQQLKNINMGTKCDDLEDAIRAFGEDATLEYFAIPKEQWEEWKKLWNERKAEVISSNPLGIKLVCSNCRSKGDKPYSLVECEECGGVW